MGGVAFTTANDGVKDTLDFTLRLTLCLLVLVLVAAREAPTSSDGSDPAPSLAGQGHRGTPDERDARPAARGPSAPARHDAGVPQPTGKVGTALLTGVASWYPANGDIAAVPWWSFGDDPVWATVSHFRDGQTFSVTVLVQDHCQCLVGTSRERAIDLSDDAFRQLAPLSAGLIRVQIEVAQQGPALPPTDVR